MTQELREKIIAVLDRYATGEINMDGEAADAIIAALRPAPGDEVTAEIDKDGVLKWAAPNYGGARTPGTKLFAYPPDAAKRIASLEAERDALSQALKDHGISHERAAITASDTKGGV